MARPWENTTTKPCGTYAAHRRHLRNGETPCPPCREAKNRYQRDRHGYQGAKQDARLAALEALEARFPSVYRELYAAALRDALSTAEVAS